MGQYTFLILIYTVLFLFLLFLLFIYLFLIATDGPTYIFVRVLLQVILSNSQCTLQQIAQLLMLSAVGLNQPCLLFYVPPFVHSSR